jgi:hypothetical protein
MMRNCSCVLVWTFLAQICSSFLIFNVFIVGAARQCNQALHYVAYELPRDHLVTTLLVRRASYRYMLLCLRNFRVTCGTLTVSSFNLLILL